MKVVVLKNRRVYNMVKQNIVALDYAHFYVLVCLHPVRCLSRSKVARWASKISSIQDACVNVSENVLPECCLEVLHQPIPVY